MTKAKPALDMRNATMAVLPTTLGMHATHNVSMGAWDDVYECAFWPTIGAVPDFANGTLGHHLRHEP